MTFETKRLILRPWKESDAESLYEYAKDPRVGPEAGWPIHTSVENSRTIIKEVLSTPGTYALILKENDKVIGSVGVMPTRACHPDVKAFELEIGYWIGVPFWGMGLVPEAVECLVNHCFLDMNCPGIWCGYYDGNEKSKRVQEKCGFTFHHSEINKPRALMMDRCTEHYTYLSKVVWETKFNNINN